MKHALCAIALSSVPALAHATTSYKGNASPTYSCVVGNNSGAGNQLSDDLDIDTHSDYPVVTNNTLDGLDILISDSRTFGAITSVDVEGNTVANSKLGGIRVGRSASSITMKNNEMTNTAVDDGTIANASHITVTGDTVYQDGSAGIVIIPRTGRPNSDAITVDSNDITIVGNHPTVQVVAATNVRVTNNTYNGGHDDTARAGVGLVDAGNY